MFKDYIKFVLARAVYSSYLNFFKWCGYTVNELDAFMDKDYEEFVIARHERRFWIQTARNAKTRTY
jgi:hypothetical protein